MSNLELKKTKSELYFEWVLVALIVVGAIAAVINFLNNRSLRHDEAALALNIVNRSFFELLQPLDMKQVAPIGFLFLEKIFAIIFGNTDWSLRIVPLLSYLFSIPLLYNLNIKLFESRKTALIACAFFALNVPIVFFASDVKQYASDVFLALLISNIALDFIISKNRRSLITFGLVGAVAVWFSNTSVIMLFAAGLFALTKTYLDSKDLKKVLMVFIPIIFWLGSFFVYYVLFIRNHPSQDYMTNWWQGSFLPLNIFSIEFYQFLSSKTFMIFADLLNYKMGWFLPMLAAAFGLAVFIKNRKVIFFVVLPVVTHLILSGLRLYPFDNRVILYLVPFFISLFAAGLWKIYEYLQTKNLKVPVALFLLPVLVTLYPLFKGFPIERNEIKQSMTYLNDNIEMNENIFVYYHAIPAFSFYRSDFPLINEENIFFMKRELQDYEMIYEIESFWLIFSHVQPINDSDEERFIINMLFEKNYEVLEKRIFYGTSVINLKRIKFLPVC